MVNQNNIHQGVRIIEAVEKFRKIIIEETSQHANVEHYSHGTASGLRNESKKLHKYTIQGWEVKGSPSKRYQAFTKALESVHELRLLIDVALKAHSTPRMLEAQRMLIEDIYKMLKSMRNKAKS